MAEHTNYCGFCLACDQPWPCDAWFAAQKPTRQYVSQGVAVCGHCGLGFAHERPVLAAKVESRGRLTTTSPIGVWHESCIVAANIDDREERAQTMLSESLHG